MHEQQQITDKGVVDAFVRAVREKNFEDAMEAHNEIIRRGIKYRLQADEVKLSNYSANARKNTSGIRLTNTISSIFKETERLLPLANQ